MVANTKVSRPWFNGKVTIWLCGFGPHHLVKASISGTSLTRSVGTTERNDTTPVKRGLSSPNSAVRTRE